MMSVRTKIQETDVDYKRIYEDFIADRRAREPGLLASGVYCEKHHVRPRSMDGGDELENLIYLTAEDHVHAHVLLGKIYGGSQWLPVWFMVTGEPSRSRGIPGRILRKAAALSRNHVSQRMREDNPAFRKEVVEKVAAVTRRRWKESPWDVSQCHTKEAAAKRKETLKNSEAWAEFQIRNTRPRPHQRGTNHPRYNATVYAWQNVATGEVTHATKREMQERHGGHSANWAKVVSGSYLHTCGWGLVGVEVPVSGQDVIRIWEHCDTGERVSCSSKGMAQRTGATVSAFNAVARGAALTAKRWRLAA